MGLFDFVSRLLNGKDEQKRLRAKTKTKKTDKPRKIAQKKSQKKYSKKTKKTLVKKKHKVLHNKVPAAKQKKTLEKQIGVVTHYFGKISVGVIKLKTELKVGDKIHIKGAHDDFVQVVQSMQIDHEDVARAKKGAEVGMKVAKPVHENDKVFQV